MLRSRFLWKLFAGYTLLITVSLALVGGLVAKRVETETLAEIDRRLLDSASFLHEIVGRRVESGGLESPESIEDLRQQLDAVGERVDIRSTVVRLDGVVLADSQEAAERMENHADRPEILAAYEEGMGLATRFSKTQGRSLRYLALPLEVDGEPYATVRTSLPMAGVPARLRDLRMVISTSALAALVLALGLGFLFARRVTQPLLEIADAADLIASGRYGQRVEASRHDELGKLARAFNTMSRELEGSVDAVEVDRNKLSAILAGMAEGVVAVDRDERIVHINDVAARLLEVEPEAVTSHPIWAVSRLHDVPEVLSEAMARNGEVVRSVRLAGLSDRVLDLRATPWGNEDQSAGAVLVMQDVTQIRRLETMRQDFVGNVSHELKTPVTAIRGMVETLIDDPGAPDSMRHRFLERVLTQTERMGNLVSDLLSLSRLQSAADQIETEVLDLRSVVRKAVRLLLPASEARGVKIECDLPDEAVLVDGDEEGLSQAIGNLLDNAIKYSPAGQSVEVRVLQTPTGVRLEVRDHGIGIAAHHQDRLFERFYRVDKARSRELGGTGLGLAIVKHTALVHGGQVSVDSIPGRGSTFRIDLPPSPPVE